MKRFFRIASMVGCLCLYLAMATLQVNAADVSTTAISLDLAAGSVELYESEGITYCVQNGVTQATIGNMIIRQTDSGTMATANTVTVSGGSCKVAISSLYARADFWNSPILVETDAALELNLLGSSTVIGGYECAGIQVPKGASLTIGGTGSITATGSSQYAAGIGGGKDSSGDSGTIIINGGTVTASGGECCAGIGGGRQGDASHITINGGTVTATGGQYGAGIGGGWQGDTGHITINGGTVTANSSEGAGIGGGSESSGGAITINGGTVTANSDIGAGIGGGWLGDAGHITINGGTVIANSSKGGTGIGGGSGSSGGAITINGGTVTANGSFCSAGIGGGEEHDYGTITISGGTVTATGGRYGGAGIGGGKDSYGGKITITDGTVTAIGGEDAADVGAGSNGNCAAVTISEKATVTNGKGNAPYVEETIFVTTQPLPSASHLNHTPVSSVAARSNSGLSYQWQTSADKSSWTDLAGATAEITTFTMTKKLDGSYVRCKLTNGWGNVKYTAAVQIYILAFVQQPVSVEANLNDVLAFEALSTCSNVTYQWQRSYDEGTTWSNVPGETFSTLIVNATLSENNAKYRCVITATNGDQLASDVVGVNVNVTESYDYTIMTYLQNLETMDYELCEQIEASWETGNTVYTADYEGFSENRAKRTQEGVLEAGTLVVHCYFDRNTYSITFDTNGGSALPDMEALYGASIAAPGVPTRYGHVFDGWYADEDLTEEYVFGTMPLNGTTVYAKWAPVGAERGVEYKINGLSIRDSDTFELLDEIPESGFLVEVSVTNLEATETDTILLVYYTDKGQMLGMNYMFANTPVGYTATFGASVDNKNGEIGIIKAFVLPFLGNPVPLAEVKSIGK